MSWKYALSNLLRMQIIGIISLVVFFNYSCVAQNEPENPALRKLSPYFGLYKSHDGAPCCCWSPDQQQYKLKKSIILIHAGGQ